MANPIDRDLRNRLDAGLTSNSVDCCYEGGGADWITAALRTDTTAEVTR